MSTTLLTLQALVALFGPVLFGWWLQRRLGTRWSTWGWGALAFVASQGARVPFLLLLTALFNANPTVRALDTDRLFWLNLAILAATSGLFEETARYGVLRWLARDARQWRDGVMFGAGHGGIEAILLVGGAAINGLVLLSMGDSLVAQVQAEAPEQAAALVAQLEALRALAWWHPVIALWERVPAMALHIAASLLVLRAVRVGRWGWWALAVLLHAFLNGATVIALRSGGPLFAEVVLTLLTPLSLYISWATWRDARREEVAASSQGG